VRAIRVILWWAWFADARWLDETWTSFRRRMLGA
jgi:hypothetical protein